MAVQKSKKSHSKKGMRRSHDSLNFLNLSTNKISGLIHIRHHIDSNGCYKNKKIFDDMENK